MKILHIIYTAGISGAEKYLKHLLPGLGSYGMECELMIVCPPAAEVTLKDFCDEFSALGVKTNMLVAKHEISFGTLKKINRFLRQNNFSVVHSHLIRTDIMMSLVKQFFYRDLFIISTKHGYREKVQKNYLPEQFKVTRDFYYWVHRYVLGKIDRNISVSGGISKLFVNLKLSKEYFPVIYHGVNVPGTGDGDLAVYKSSTPQLLIVGRLEEYKGHRYAFEAMQLILEKYPAATLVLLGDGSYKNTLIKLAVELGIAKSVLFPGFQKDPYSFISASDIIIVPSLFEPFGLVFIEAMGLKKPIAAFDVPAGNELLHGETAVLVKRADSRALAEKILFLLENPEITHRLTEKAYAEYLEKYTVAVMAKNTAGYYASLNIRQN